MRRWHLCFGALLVQACGWGVTAQAATLTMLTHYTDAQDAPLAACLRHYQQDHPDIHVVQRQVEIEDYLQTVLIGHLGGTSPDIYNIYAPISAAIIKAGVLDHPPIAISHMVDIRYLPTSIDAIRVNGNTWGIPAEVSVYLLIYNKTLFRQAGIARPPKDWDEVVADAARVTQRNANGKLTVAGFAFGPTIANTVYPFTALLLSKGGTLFDSDNNLAGPAAIGVLTEQATMYSRGITDNTITVDDFIRGNVGMMIQANWVKGVLSQALGSTFDDTVGVAPIPAGDTWKTVQYAFFWAVDAKSPNKQAAWDLLSWLNRSQADNTPSCTGTMLHGMGALTGNRQDLSAYDDRFSAPFAQAIASGRAVALPNLLRGSEIMQDLRLAIGRTWSGETAPAASLRAAWRRIAALLADID